MAHDIQLVDGDLPTRTSHITGVELIAQRVRIRLLTHHGEWLLDRRVGLPYLRWRGQKPPRVQTIASRVRETIRDVPGVVDVRDLTAELVDRRVVVTGRIVVAGGEELELEAGMLQAGNISPTIALTLATSGAIL